MLPLSWVEELPGVLEEDEEVLAQLTPPGQDPLHHLAQALTSWRRQDCRGLVG
jgi:hypothetical protein